jgi:double-stranded uracil-DNA glycosylase
MSKPPAPSRQEIESAAGRKIPDVIGSGLKVLFCGINPGLYSGATGFHFARPGNRFWPALHLSGFTHRRFEPYQQGELLALGLGITNIVERTTASAAELTREEITAGGERLREKTLQHKPYCLAVLGIGVYRQAFFQPKAVLGLQPDKVGSSLVWVLPNPSGLNAHYSLAGLADLFREMRIFVEDQLASG